MRGGLRAEQEVRASPRAKGVLSSCGGDSLGARASLAAGTPVSAARDTGAAGRPAPVLGEGTA